MLEDIPVYAPLTFALTTMATLVLFGRILIAPRLFNLKVSPIIIISGLLFWLVIQAVLSMNGVYSFDTDSFPPNIMLFAILPPLLLIAFLFATPRGRKLVDSLNLQDITFLNVVRIPVELVLFWLYLHNLVPELMTFEGRNFDIIAGLTAPLLVYFTFVKKKIENNGMLIWNIVSLALLVNIVLNAILSAPSPIQQFAFEQPNIAILYFPYSWLPSFIVPIIMFGHLVSIRQIIMYKPI